MTQKFTAEEVRNPANSGLVGDRREAFEKYVTDDGMWGGGIKRDSAGEYIYMDTSRCWPVWQAAWDAALAAQGQGDAVAWLHTVTQGDGETDQALSFSPDSFPLDTQLGFRSIGSVPLYTHPVPPASPAGVPDVTVGSCTSTKGRVRQHTVSIGFEQVFSTACEQRAKDVAGAIRAALRTQLDAAPSAPEGDGDGGEG